MKEKDILKLLKKEVNSITPNNYTPIKREVENIQKDKKKLSVTNESFSTHKKWVSVFASCMLIIVAVIGISIPFVFGNEKIMNTLFKNYEQTEEKVEDDEQDNSQNDSTVNGFNKFDDII